MRDWLRECLRKKAYHKERHAEQVREKCEEERGVKLRVYKCSYCGHYHLTKKPAA